jgi:hypothetical protein
LNTDRIEKKLREGEHFLGKMLERERMMAGDREIFDYNLSAFLNAGRTVDYRLHHAQGAMYAEWRKAWDPTLSPAESELMKFMADDRADEVHRGGSQRNPATEDVEVLGGSYSDRSGALEVSSVPGAKTFVTKIAYTFTIGGTEQRATDACKEYMALLKRMVDQFRTDNP